MLGKGQDGVPQIAWGTESGGNVERNEPHLVSSRDPPDLGGDHGDPGPGVLGGQAASQLLEDGAR